MQRRIRDSGGVSYTECSDAGKASAIAAHYRKLVDRGVNLHDIVALTPYNDGPGGDYRINVAIRAALGFPPFALAKGDMILVTQNDYGAFNVLTGDDVEIYNGERATIVRVGPDTIDIEFPGSRGRDVRVVRLLTDGPGKLPEGTKFGFALTVHKAQGSEFDHVLFAACKGHPKGIVQRPLVYTGISRGREEVTVFGQWKEFQQACTVPGNVRTTYLKYLLQHDKTEF